MPIYDQTYRKHEARGPLRRVRFWPIAREALRLVLARRVVLGLLVALWIPWVVCVVLTYLFFQVPEASRPFGLSVLFQRFLDMYTWLALFPMVFAGSGLIANDLKTGAVLVYLSRPLTRRDYVLGKLVVLLSLGLSLTLAPAGLLYLAALGIAPQEVLRWDRAFLLPAIVIHSVLATVVASLVCLAVSALSRSATAAGLGFFGLMLVLDLLLELVKAVLDQPAVILLSIQADVEAVGKALFGVGEPGLHWVAPVAVLLAVGAGCLAVLRSRVRAVEIVQ